MFADAVPRFAPRWLRRSIGGRLLRGVGMALDDLVQASAEGIAARFPVASADTDPDALALIGRDRRIRRGPVEDDDTYAARLRPWLAAHRIRGSHYALLPQLQAYLRGVLDARIEGIDYSGKRVAIAPDGTLTQDTIVWDADGSGRPARVWIFVYAAGAAAGALMTGGGDTLVTDDGDVIALDLDLDVAANVEDLAVLVREWLAGHIEQATIVLLDGLGRLWDYPEPVPTWDEWYASGATWDDPLSIAVVEL